MRRVASRPLAVAPLIGLLASGVTLTALGSPAAADDPGLVLAGQRFTVDTALDIEYALVSTDPLVIDDLARGPAVPTPLPVDEGIDDAEADAEAQSDRRTPLPPPDDRVLVRVALHRVITSRFEVSGALIGDPGPVIDVVTRPLVDLIVTDLDGRQRLRVEHPVVLRDSTTGRRPDALEAPTAGLHPVSVSIVRDGAELARHVTIVDHRPVEPAEDAPRLGISVAAAIGVPGASVGGDLTTSEMLGVRTAVERTYVLARDVDLPISLALEPRLAPLIATGEILVGLGPEPLDALLAADGGEVIALADERVDPSAVAAIGEDDRFVDALADGRILLEPAFPSTPIIDSLWVAEGRVTSSNLTPSGAGVVRDLGRTAVVMSRDVYLAHGGAVGATTDATLSAAIAIGPGDTVPAIVLDTTAALLDVGARPTLTAAERAVRVIAEVTAMRRTGPMTDRWYVISGTDLQVPDAEVVGHLARMFADDPTVTPAPLSAAVRTIGAMVDDSGRPIVITWGSGPEVDLTDRLPTVDSLRAVVFDVSTVLPDDDPRITEWVRGVDRLFSAGVDDAEVATEADRIRAEVSTVRAAIVLPARTSFTLTDRDTPLPLLIENRGSVPLRIAVRLVSDRLDVPPDPVEVVVRPGSNTVRVDVTARTNGTFPVAVEILSPAGNRLIEPVTLTARVNSVSGLGRLVAVGLVLVLLSWWYSHLRRSRPGDRPDGTTPSTSDT
ncbi:MAG: hypothetical protein RIR49_322 [Actinomycetota bacterium]